jgi:hypothetical protein
MRVSNRVAEEKEDQKAKPEEQMECKEAADEHIQIIA